MVSVILMTLVYVQVFMFDGELSLNKQCNAWMMICNLFIPDEEVKVPSVRPSWPEGRQGASSSAGLVLCQDPAAAAAVPASPDPQSAAAELQLPGHPAGSTQVRVESDLNMNMKIKSPSVLLFSLISSQNSESEVVQRFYLH